jgi:hypothetical protein
MVTPLHEGPPRRRLPRPTDAPYTTRAALYSLTFLFAFSLLLAAGNLLFTSALTHRAEANAASITQLCQSSNEARAQQVVLWTHLVVISHPPPHETVAARTQRVKTTRQFIAYVHHVFAPRNCSKE